MSAPAAAPSTRAPTLPLPSPLQSRPFCRTIRRATPTAKACNWTGVERENFVVQTLVFDRAVLSIDVQSETLHGVRGVRERNKSSIFVPQGQEP